MQVWVTLPDHVVRQRSMSRTKVRQRRMSRTKKPVGWIEPTGPARSGVPIARARWGPRAGPMTGSAKPITLSCAMLAR